VFAEMSFDESDFDFEMEEEIGSELFVPDPLEMINRPIFKFNLWTLKLTRPVAKTYRLVPSPIRRGVDNFFINLGQPLSLVNEFLQGKLDSAAQRCGDFVVNSTVGLGGLLRVRSESKGREDFGQTLGFYGLHPGWYLQLPFMGPTSVRDVFSMPLNGTLLGERYLFPHSAEARLGVWSLRMLEVIDESERRLSLLGDSIDPYLFVRDAYWQGRESAIQH
jgi:phospholipid-binding lipoprotein MlaA